MVARQVTSIGSCCICHLIWRRRGSQSMGNVPKRQHTSIPIQSQKVDKILGRLQVESTRIADPSMLNVRGTASRLQMLHFISESSCRTVSGLWPWQACGTCMGNHPRLAPNPTIYLPPWRDAFLVHWYSPQIGVFLSTSITAFGAMLLKYYAMHQPLMLQCRSHC